MPPYTVGIIGCGQIGTMVLTKLLEAQSSFNNLRVLVSTRQPHLLRPFTQEFGVTAEFNNERIIHEADIVFICVLPGQAGEVFKEIKYAMDARVLASKKNSKLSAPLIVSCLAATGIPKLKLMLLPEACFIRTRLNVQLMRRYLQATNNEVPKFAAHPTKNPLPISQQSQEQGIDLTTLSEGGSAVAKDTSQILAMQGQRNHPKQALEDKLRKCLSTKAIKIGKEHGVTAEFII